VLRSLTPAEQLAGYDDAIRNLGAKLDLICAPAKIPQRSQARKRHRPHFAPSSPILASNDALARLSDGRAHHCRPGSIQLARSKTQRFVYDLEQRIAAPP